MSETIKVTIYGKSEFMNNIIKRESHLKEFTFGKYAQYYNCLFITHRPKRKHQFHKKTCTPCCGSPDILILDGWGHPTPDGIWGKTESRIQEGTGAKVSTTSGRYMSHDPRWQSDFDGMIDEYIELEGTLVLLDTRSPEKYNAEIAKFHKNAVDKAENTAILDTCKKETTHTKQNKDTHMSKNTEEKAPKQYTYYGQKLTLEEWAKICQLPAGKFESTEARLKERASKGWGIKDAMLKNNDNEEGMNALEKIKVDYQAANPPKDKGERKPVEMECVVTLKSGKYTIKRDKSTGILAYKGKSETPEKNSKGILKDACTELGLKFEKPAGDFNTRQLGVRVITAINEAGK